MKPKHLLAAYSVFIFAVIISAYLQFIPLTLNFTTNDDSIGHFVLFGLWGYLFGKTFYKPALQYSMFAVQKGIAFIIPVVIAEELLQSLSPIRTFSLFDMGWGVLGILLGCVLLNYQNGFWKKASAQKLLKAN